MENQQSMQEQYLADIKQIIEDNIDNENFSVADLAREVGLSRSMMHRKLIRLTGKSATDLITEIRLTKAYELLENNVGTVSEIAYQVGYSSPSYFNKVFKKTYKVSAGDVRRKGSGKVSHLRIVKEPGVPGSGRSKRFKSNVLIGTNILMIVIITLGAVALILGIMEYISPILRIPAWTMNLILLILIAGFIIASVLSRIYNNQLEGGMEKTESADTIKPGDKSVTLSKRRIVAYVSVVVIVGLVFLNLMGSNRIRPGDIQSLLVLPIENFTGDDQLDIVISGMHNSLIGDLGRISGFTVISKTTSDVYKDTDKTLSQIASERGVDAIIEAAVMCLGDTICFEFRMITPDEKQIMNVEYREAKGELLNVQNRVIKQISDKVRNELTANEMILLAESRTADPDALEAYLKGLHYWDKLTDEDLQMARQFFERAIEIDPDWGPPYTGMARVWFIQVYFGAVPLDIGIQEAYKYLDKAVELDHNSAIAHYTKAQIAAWLEWDWVTAEREYLVSLELNPNDALCLLYYSHMLMCLRRFDEAVYLAKLGLDLDPERPLILGLYGFVMRGTGNYQSAIEYSEKAISIDPDFKFAWQNLWYSALYSGDHKRWIPLWKEYSCWDDTVKTSFEKTIYEDGLVTATEKLIEYNEKYGSPECQMGIWNELMWSAIVKDFDKTLDCLEELYKVPMGELAYIAANIYGNYDQLIEYPRYIELLKKINLPLPED